MPIRITRTPPSNSSYVNLVRTELMRAVNMRNDAEVERLLAAGANVNARGNNGYTALMRTVRGANNRPRDRRGIIQQLIMAGANVNARGPNGRTVRNYAINGNRTNRGNRQEAINAALEYSYTRSNNRWYNRLHRRPAIEANLRAKANTPVNRNWTVMNNGTDTVVNKSGKPVIVRRYKTDPISLLNKTNWNGNKAIEVNQNGHKTYFTLGSFNGYYGNRWKNMAPNSKTSIHDTKTHPLTRQPIMRKNVRLVKFIGNKNKA